MNNLAPFSLVALLAASLPSFAQTGFPGAEGGRLTRGYDVIGVWELQRPVPLGGDVDGDLIEDFMVRNNREKYGGGIFMLRSGADGSLIRSHISENAWWKGDHLGQDYDTLGDLNGDGAPEYIASAPGSQRYAKNGGYVNLYDGASGAIIRDVSRTRTYGYFGVELCTGDFNGDGVSDFAALSGQASAFLSRGSKFERIVIYSGADFDQSNWQPIRNRRFADPVQAELHGIEDVNGDGTDEILIRRGSEYQLINGADLVPIFTFPQGYSHMRAIGDVDGDSITEFYAAEPGFNGGLGRILIYSGASFTVLREHLGDASALFNGPEFGGIGDLDHDGVPDYAGRTASKPSSGAYRGTFVVYSGATGRELANFLPTYKPEAFGMGGCFGLDVDGDGRNEMLVNSSTYHAGGRAESGVVSVFHFDTMIEQTSKQLLASTGGRIDFDLDFEGAGLEYLLLGSLSGVGASAQGSIQVPIVYDTLTARTYLTPPSWLVNSQGVTNGAGQATASLIALPGQLDHLVGKTLRFSAVGFNGSLGGGVHWATRPAVITINP